MIVILGAGIAGVSAAYHLSLKGIDSTLFEKRSRWGGLCDNFEIDGFRFDNFIHLSFSKNDYVKELFRRSSSYISHNPKPYNFYHGSWLQHPAQNNIYPLTTEEKIRIIKGFINRKSIDDNFVSENYDQWLKLTFGDYFHKNFTELYTKKYWTISPEMMSTEWINNRIHQPNIDEILLGAFESKTPNYYYAQEMRYPFKGGYKSFLKGMTLSINIKLNKEVILIDTKLKLVEFSDGTNIHYTHLISSLPLPEIIPLIKDVPREILQVSENLLYTSGQLVSLGFNSLSIPEHLWFYIYDDDIYPCRAYSPSQKSEYNVPEGCSSLQFETYYSKYKPKRLSNDDLIQHIVEKGSLFGWFDKNRLKIADCREVKYANVVYDLERHRNLTIIKDYMKEKDIHSIGRFGEWEYFWSDQSLMSGKRKADEFTDEQ